MEKSLPFESKKLKGLGNKGSKESFAHRICTNCPGLAALAMATERNLSTQWPGAIFLLPTTVQVCLNIALVIASPEGAKQSDPLDCFVAALLAMTRENPAVPLLSLLSVS